MAIRPDSNARDSYLHPYGDYARSHGTGFGVTLWASPESQQRRFKIMNDMWPMTGQRVLDAGCSRGDFAAWLIEKGLLFEAFIGVDGIADVIEAATARNMARCQFVHGDFLANPAMLASFHPTVVTVSGTLNTMNLDQAVSALEGCWAAAHDALIFNFLSDTCGPKAPPQAYPAKRLSTMKLLDWAFSRTWCVQFRQDYFDQGHDATILMCKVRRNEQS